MRAGRFRTFLGVAGALALIVLAGRSLGLAAGGASSRAALPAIVFVSREPARTTGVVPGLGLHGRLLASGGKLLVREPAGRVRPLLREGALFDVADPCVSWDARTIVFSGTPAPDAPWRLYTVGVDGRGLRAVAADSAEGARRYDDFDPCWLPDGRICFASTRWPQRAQRGEFAASNLFVVNTDGSGLERITAERNSASEPAVDPASGRVLYSRWFFNRWLASDLERSGATADPKRAIPAERVNQWQVVSIQPDGDGLKLAAGDPRTRPSSAGDQPLVLADGSVLAVRGDALAAESLSRQFVVQRSQGGVGSVSLVAGFGVEFASAVSPAALPSGGLVLAADRDGRGDYGLFARAPGGGWRSVVDLPRTLELDPAVIFPRRAPPVLALARERRPTAVPATRLEQLTQDERTFRFDCLNVFAQGPVDGVFPDAVPMQRDVRIRFFATLSRPERAGGDTIVLLREEPVRPNGGVHVDNLPGDVPGFEQLVDARGNVLQSQLGPAHVPGSNFAPAGSGTKCVGCHAGHSALPVPPNYSSARWTNAAPSARALAIGPGGEREVRGAVDRRTLGDPDRVAWVSDDPLGEKLQLRWRSPIEVREVVLYALRADRVRHTNTVVSECELSLFDGDREVERRVLREALSPLGTHASCNGGRVDRLELRLLRWDGRILGREAAGLAELEIIARLIED